MQAGLLSKDMMSVTRVRGSSALLESLGRLSCRATLSDFWRLSDAASAVFVGWRVDIVEPAAQHKRQTVRATWIGQTQNRETCTLL